MSFTDLWMKNSGGKKSDGLDGHAIRPLFPSRESCSDVPGKA